MHVIQAEKTDDFILNTQVARLLGDGLEIFKGKNGYKVKTKIGKYDSIVNWRNPEIVHKLLEDRKINVIRDDNGVYRAKAEGQRIGAMADDRALAVVLAAIKAEEGKVLV